MCAVAEGRSTHARLSSRHAASEARAFGHEPERASRRGAPLAMARGARARLAAGAALRSGRAKRVLASHQTDSAKSLRFREDVWKTRSKTCVSRRLRGRRDFKKRISLDILFFQPAASSTGRLRPAADWGSWLHVFPENTWESPVASERGSARRPCREPAGFTSDGQREIIVPSGRISEGRAQRPALRGVFAEHVISRRKEV